jgi:hypothetical protein
MHIPQLHRCWETLGRITSWSFYLHTTLYHPTNSTVHDNHDTEQRDHKKSILSTTFAYIDCKWCQERFSHFGSQTRTIDDCSLLSCKRIIPRILENVFTKGMPQREVGVGSTFLRNLNNCSTTASGASCWTQCPAPSRSTKSSSSIFSQTSLLIFSASPGN